MTRYYPINLDIRGRRCLVVGGGAVGTRKAAGLLECGAIVTVVSPASTDALRQWAGAGRIILTDRPYAAGDLSGMFLVIGATDDDALNRRVHADAEARSILCNIADRPEICNFILPAVTRRGDLVIAVSTSGSSPAFAKRLRKEMEAAYGPEYGSFLSLMRAIRRRLLQESHAPEEHRPLFEALIEGGLVRMIREEDADAADALLRKTLGPGFSFSELSSELSSELPSELPMEAEPPASEPEGEAVTVPSNPKPSAETA